MSYCDQEDNAAPWTRGRLTWASKDQPLVPQNQLPQKLSTILPLCLSSRPSRRVAWYAPILLDLRQQGLGCRGCPVAKLLTFVPSINNGALEIGDNGEWRPNWSALSASIPVPKGSRFWKPLSMKHRLGIYQTFLATIILTSVVCLIRSPACFLFRVRFFAEHLGQAKGSTEFSSRM
jgi:hypothetical protein